MCPHCRAFITTSDSTCPYCNERVGPKAIELRNTGEMIGGLIPQARFVTILLLIINGGFFLATSMYPGGCQTIPAMCCTFLAPRKARQSFRTPVVAPGHRRIPAWRT